MPTVADIPVEPTVTGVPAPPTVTDIAAAPRRAISPHEILIMAVLGFGVIASVIWSGFLTYTAIVLIKHAL